MALEDIFIKIDEGMEILRLLYMKDWAGFDDPMFRELMTENDYIVTQLLCDAFAPETEEKNK